MIGPKPIIISPDLICVVYHRAFNHFKTPVANR